MNKDTIEGFFRLALAFLAGYLLFGWRGGVGTSIIFWLYIQGIKDMAEINVALAKKLRG